MYTELKKVLSVWVIIHSWGEIPVFATLVVWGWLSKNGTVVDVWVEFAQRSCQSSEISLIRLRKNINKPELKSMANKLDQSEIDNSHNKQTNQSHGLPTCLKYIWNEGSSLVDRL